MSPFVYTVYYKHVSVAHGEVVNKMVEGYEELLLV